MPWVCDPSVRRPQEYEHILHMIQQAQVSAQADLSDRCKWDMISWGDHLLKFMDGTSTSSTEHAMTDCERFFLFVFFQKNAAYALRKGILNPSDVQCLHENQALQKYLSTANNMCTLAESCLSLCFEHRYPTTVTEEYLLKNPN